jgi:hypothetical protein
MTLEDQIPGLREAIERENSAWDAAWLGLNESICGVEVKAYTPRHDLILGWNGLRSPFLGGDWPKTDRELLLAIRAFLWTVSPQFGKGPLKQLWLFWRIRKLDARKVVNDIQRYLSEAYSDAPASSGPGSPQFNSWFSDICDLFWFEYSAHRNEIIDMPMKQIFQLCKSMKARKKPDCHLFKPSDRIIGEWLKEQNAKSANVAEN